MTHPLPLKDIRVTDEFFLKRIRIAREQSIPYMWRALNDLIPGVPPSGCVRNFRIAAGLETGEFTGWWFQDSDLWKWIEGAAYSLTAHPDAALEQDIDSVIDLAEKAQQDDGYLDTYYIMICRRAVDEPPHADPDKLLRNFPKHYIVNESLRDKRFTNLRDHHELYVAGHLFEAAVAYFEATGKKKLLGIACRFADCIDARFGEGEGKLRGYPGHEEIEIGLTALYRITGEARYLALAKFFLDQRGQQPYYFDIESEKRGEAPHRDHHRYPQPAYSYHQANQPVREQTEATGHAVRQLYLLAGMADVGAEADDETLVRAADRVFADITDRQMYVTGGVGSSHDGEAFTFDYDLPPDTCYCESCASIALMMTAARLGRVKNDARYGDTVERALYNGVLPGVSLDGTKYFYINPLEVWRDRCLKRAEMQVDPERKGWFGCACCPPNILRTLTGLGKYLYAADENALYIEQYVSSEAKATLGGEAVRLTLTSGFPWDGHVRAALSLASPARFALRFRVPAWAAGFTATLNGAPLSRDTQNGYLVIERTFTDGDEIALDFAMPARFLTANGHIPDYAGKTALTRGPLVYCLEETDNGGQLWMCAADAGAPARASRGLLPEGAVSVECEGVRETTGDALYGDQAPDQTPTKLTFVPYYLWGNRGAGDMTVWVRRLRK